LQEEIAEFPEKARLTFPRLQKEIYEAASSDFSFGMSRKELRWHEWLLEYRSPDGGFDAIEYLWRPDLDGNLNWSGDACVFQWTTIDGKWSGTIYFRDASPKEADWIRHVCTTLALTGDLVAFDHLADATIKSMIQFSARQDSG